MIELVAYRWYAVVAYVEASIPIGSSLLVSYGDTEGTWATELVGRIGMHLTCSYTIAQSV